MNSPRHERESHIFMENKNNKQHNRRRAPVRQGQVLAGKVHRGPRVQGTVSSERRRRRRAFHDKYGSSPVAAGAVRDRTNPSGYADHPVLLPEMAVGTNVAWNPVVTTTSSANQLEPLLVGRQAAGEVIMTRGFTQFTIGTLGFGALVCTGSGIPFSGGASGMIVTTATYANSLFELSGGTVGWANASAPPALRGASIDEDYGAILLGLRLRVRSVSSSISATKGTLLVGQTNGETLDARSAISLLGERWTSYVSVFPQMDDPVLIVRPNGLYVPNFAGMSNPTAAPTSVVWDTDCPGGFAFVAVTGGNAGDVFTVEIQQRLLYLGPNVSNISPLVYDGDLWACVERCMSLSLQNDSGFTVFPADTGDMADGETTAIVDDAIGHTVIDRAKDLPGALFRFATEGLPDRLLEGALKALF